MRLPFSFIQGMSLFWAIGLFSAGLSIAAADTPSSVPHRIQIRCIAIRASGQDVDAMGINFSLMSSESLDKAPDVSLPVTSTPRFALMKTGSEVRVMLDRLAKLHTSIFTAPLVTAVDGRSVAIPLSKLKDPGMVDTSELIVTPSLHSDGTITLSITPQFKFVYVPGPDNPAAPVSVDAFPMRRTLSSGSFLVFTDTPARVPGKRFSQYLPVIPSVSRRDSEDMHSTQLWLFLMATVLPDASA